MRKRWIYVDDSDLLPAVHALSQELGVSPLVARLLAQRGIRSSREAEEFLSPSTDQLHNPFLMPDMEKAVRRLERAVFGLENIIVYGDYDVDGTTAVTLVHAFLRDLGVTSKCYVPDRHEEGAGISEKSIRFAATNGYSLMVVLDTGIKANEQVALARRLGVDIIICDHHLPGDQIPEAYAILDPKLPGSTYPFRELSACAVGYKFLQAYTKRNGVDRKVLDRYLDLVAVSIMSDLVDLRGENRILALEGLKVLNENPSPGLAALIHSLGLEGRTLTRSDVVFKLGPRINAAGRMVTGMHAVRLLTARNAQEARPLAEGIEINNRERQVVDRRITLEAVAMIAERPSAQHMLSLVVYNPSWHKGVIAIVASRLVETYFKPTVVLTEYKGLASGSARSVGDFDLYAAVSACADLLESYGGHRYAVGLSLKPERIEEFARRFEEYVSEHITEAQRKPQCDIHAVIDLDELDGDTVTQLLRFAPFGPGNPPPILEVDNVRPDPKAQYVGRQFDHVRFRAQQVDARTRFHAVGFNLGGHLQLVSSQPFRMCFSIERNYYFTPPKIQLNILDIKPM